MTIVLGPCFGAGAQFFDDSGDPLSGGLLSSYLAGTTTLTPTWTDHTGAAFNTNPIVLDAAGRVPEQIWIDLALQYKFVLTNSVLVQIWVKDYISWFIQPDTDMANLANATDPTLGDALIGFQQSNSAGVLAGAVSKTVHDKLQEFVSVKDFGAAGDGVTDDSAAILLATRPGRLVHFPAGTYIIGTSMTISNMDEVTWNGDSGGTTKICAKSGAAFTAPLFTATACKRWEIRNLAFDWNGNTACNANPLIWLREMSGLHFVNSAISHGARGLFLRACFDSIVDTNVFEMAIAAATENYNLYVGDDVLDPVSLSEIGDFTNNIFARSGAYFAGRSFTITDNLALGSKFGAGITTETTLLANTTPAKAYTGHIISNNSCHDNSGKDAFGPVVGMRIRGQYHTVSGNNCYFNGGAGIVWSAWKSALTANLCWGNGTEATLTSAQKTGIEAFAGVDSIARPDYSFISGNRCAAEGTQNYGYTENANISFMAVAGNDFSDNLVAETLLDATNLSNSYDIDTWVAFTPTIISSVGTITALGAVTARYLRRGQIVHYSINIRITTNGTGAGELLVMLPFSNADTIAIFSGGGGSANPVSQVGRVAVGSTVKVTDYLGAYPGGNGFDINLSGSCGF
jgi:hypothetical protein